MTWRDLAGILRSLTNRLVKMAITRDQRARIIFLHGRGESKQAIADEVGCSLSTVQRWLTRYASTGSLETARIPGKPRCTTEQQASAMVEAAAVDHATARSVHLQLGQQHSVSYRTVLRRLHQAGMHLRTRRKREQTLALPSTQAKRQQWCEREVRAWDGWADRTVYVDEALFHSDPMHRKRQWVRRGTRGRVTQWVYRSSRISIGVFGAMCGDQLLPLFVCSGKFTSTVYRDLIVHLYWPLVGEMIPDGEFRWQQDNAPTHRGAVIREWLEDEPPERLKRAWSYQPSYSPDLNPIEHVWARIKIMLSGKFYRTPELLTVAVLRAWDEVGQDRAFLQGLTASMPRRLDAVILADGGPTRY